jgi:uncharacterized protein (TIGR00255 family)
MTGYGLASLEDDNYVISAEVKTLNSKFLDLSIRSPRQFSEKEHEIRNLISAVLERGKVNLTLEFTNKTQVELPVLINEELFHGYYQRYLKLAKDAQADTGELFKIAMQSPNVVSGNIDKNSDPIEWEMAKKVIEKALRNCDGFRNDEGKVLEQKFLENVQVIGKELEKVKILDPERKEKIRNRIKGSFREWMEDNSFDPNRLEQELIYYFEKIDITEEIVRLETHLDYFVQNLSEGENQGKKLGFISQEIGREINTIGSKANDAQVQRCVVIMKDELEKIKEQSLNIL